MTRAETKLWYEIRRDRTGVRFYRQRAMLGYVVDFYAPRARLVIEVDGGQHFDPESSEKDRIRDERLLAKGYRVLRFANDEVLERTEDVLGEICRHVAQRWPGARPKI